MLKPRVIPVLLLKEGGLVKTLSFDEPKYIGDPINAVKIYNDLEVDELILLDIEATKHKNEPNIAFLTKLASEAFMPLAYGGGVTSVVQMKDLFRAGIEKVVVNNLFYKSPQIVAEAVKVFGSQSIVVSVDVLGKNGTYSVAVDNGKTDTGINVLDYVKQIEKIGAGEIFLNSVDRDGTMSGYEVDLIEKVVSAVSIPVIACGGASDLDDFAEVFNKGKASAAAGGSYFVFCGSRDAIIISYPDPDDLEEIRG